MTSIASKAIGIFDSGIGGLTIANAIAKNLPQENLIYFGDTAHLPYGDKSAETIKNYSLKIADFLLGSSCKILVIACNSASSAAYTSLIEKYRDRAEVIINVVDPLVNEVVTLAPKKVGIIATKATISSGVYENLIKGKAPNIDIYSKPTPLFVPMIEEGFIHNKISYSIIDQYLGDTKFRDIEALLLACTHYPLIKQEISAYFDHKVKILDSTEVTTAQLKAVLNEKGWANHTNLAPKRQFLVSDLTESFVKTAKHFYGKDVDLKLHSI